MANTKYNPPIPREIEVTVGKGVAATLAIPPGLDSQNAFAENLAPATHKSCFDFTWSRRSQKLLLPENIGP